jgi:hypothetical protein
MVARASMSAPCSPPARRESRAEVCAHRCSARSPAAVEVLLVLREGEARGKRLAVSDLHLLRHYPTVAEHRRRRIRRARRQFLARRCCSGQGGGWTWCGVWYQVSGSAGSSMICVKLCPTWVVFWCVVSRRFSGRRNRQPSFGAGGCIRVIRSKRHAAASASALTQAVRS